MDEVYRNLFPCKAIPEDPGQARLIGLYGQGQEGLWLQRVKVPGGRLTGSQWRALAEIARRFTPRTPLHLTTRQDVEIHDLTAEQVPAVQEALASAGLSCLGAAGDTWRNVTVCPCSGTLAGRADLSDLAGRIEDMLRNTPGTYELPRKFKISLSCDETCGQPWINDIGLITASADGRTVFQAVLAGSLGPRPGTGVKLFERLEPNEVLPMVSAAVGVFAAHGDRTNRARARLRYVRERMGEETFAKRMREAFRVAKAERDWPAVDFPSKRGTFTDSITICFPNGDLRPAEAEILGELQDDGHAVRISTRHQVVIYSNSATELEEAAKALPGRANAAVVACPGRRWCSRALAGTNDLADRIRSELGLSIPAGTEVSISGCPNGCSQAAVADFGLIGRVAADGGDRREVFDLYVGGGMGRDSRLARKTAEKLSADEAVARVAACLAAPTERGGRRP